MAIKQRQYKNNREKKEKKKKGRTKREEVKLQFKVQLYTRQKQRLVIG